MVPDTSRQRTLANAVSVVVIAVLLEQVIAAVLGPQRLSDGLALAADGALTVLSWTLLLGGVYAALRLERYDRPLLVVAPAVFVGSLLLGLPSLFTADVPGRYLLNAFVGSALQQSAAVVAVTLVVRAAFDLPSRSGDRPARSRAD